MRTESMETLRIGELAARGGVGVETIRFYERKGLLEEPARTASGYRRYEQTALDRLRFIRRAKELGFTLSEIDELLSLATEPGHACADVEHLARAKIEDLEALGRAGKAEETA